MNSLQKWLVIVRIGGEEYGKMKEVLKGIVS